MPRARSPRALVVNIILVGVALTLLALAVWGNRAQLRQVFARTPDFRLFGLAFAVYVAALVLTFLRWYVLVRALDLPFRVRDAMRLGFIGNVFNLVIPGAVGGDVIKAAFLCREQARRTLAVASMVIDRLLGLLGLFVLAGISGAIAWSHSGADVRRLIVVAWTAAALGVVGLAVLFTPALYRPLRRVVAGREHLEALFDELVSMASSYRQRIGTVAAMLVLATGIHALYVLAFYTVSRALFPAGLPSLGEHYVICPLILFTTAVPLPFGALGLTEQVSGQLFGLANHPGGAVAMMGYRVLMYASGLLSACVYAANARQVREVAQAEVPCDLGAENPAVAPVGHGRADG